MQTSIEAHSPDTVGASDELTLATALYQALASGHDRLGYNVSGTFALWARGPGGRGWLPVQGAESVPRGEWRPCLEVLPDGSTRPRRVNPWVIREHVRGRYAVAPQAPSWTQWIAFDLDAHVAAEVLGDVGDEVIPIAAIRRALAKRDSALAELWRAFDLGPGREPVIFETPGQGLHVYLPITRGELSPIEHTRPAGWVIEWVADRLHRAGVCLEPGRLELYPAGRPLRAPCGARMTLMRATRPDQPDALGLAPVAGTTALRRTAKGGDAGVERVRRPWSMVAAFLAAWEATRRPLEAWLGDERAAWSAALGPFVRPERDPSEGVFVEKSGWIFRGVDPKSQDKDEVPGRPGGRSREIVVRAGSRDLAAVGQGGDRSAGSGSGSSSTSPTSSPSATPPTVQRASGGVLRRGREFRAYLVHLLRHGVVTPGTRHDAVLSLVFGWHVQGRREDEVRAELEAWARAHPHVSRLKGERFVRQCLREGMHYYHRIKKLPQRARSLAAAVARMRPLRPADLLVVAKVRAEVREEAWAILEYLNGHADPGGDVLEPVTLGRAQLDALTVGDRRIRIDGKRHRAEVLAVRELERLGVLALYIDYSRGRHGRVFGCWYSFGSGVLPAPREPGAQADARGAPRGGAGGEALVLGERSVREGTLRVLSDGTRRVPWVELAPHPFLVVEASGGGAWWRDMYERRRFTVRDLRAADEAVVIAGPWAPSPRPPAAPARYGELVEELPRRRPVAIAAAPAAPIADPRAELARALGADPDQVADFDPEIAAVAARALAAFDRRP